MLEMLLIFLCSIENENYIKMKQLSFDIAVVLLIKIKTVNFCGYILLKAAVNLKQKWSKLKWLKLKS